MGITATTKASSFHGGSAYQLPACARGPDTRGAGWLCVSPDLVHCMQTHGVPDFPEPNAQGWAPAAGINTNSPSFQAASDHCLPNSGAQPTPAENPQVLAQALRFSRCMRSHGIADFPDPGSSARGGTGTQAGKGSDLDPENSRFQAAERACRGK